MTTFAPSSSSFKRQSRMRPFAISIEMLLVQVSSTASRSASKNVLTSSGKLVTYLVPVKLRLICDLFENKSKTNIIVLSVNLSVCLSACLSGWLSVYLAGWNSRSINSLIYSKTFAEILIKS